MLEFVSNFGNPTAPLPAAIVACVPKKVHVEGKGETEFAISPSEIVAAIKAGLEEPIEPEPEVSFHINLARSSVKFYLWLIHFLSYLRSLRCQKN